MPPSISTLSVHPFSWGNPILDSPVFDFNFFKVSSVIRDRVWSRNGFKTLSYVRQQHPGSAERDAGPD
jgi:hypothetical protein